MNETLKLLADAISPAKAATREYLWEDLLCAVEDALASQFDRETERVMLAILRFDGRLHLSALSELPHSMNPEDMLKSFALQWLVKETRLTHLMEMQRVETTTASPVLASIVQAMIRRPIPPDPPARRIEAVEEIRPWHQRSILAGPEAPGIGHKPLNMLLQLRGRPKLIADKPVRNGRYTVYAVRWATMPVNKVLLLQHGLTCIPRRRGTRALTEADPALA